MTKGTSSQRSLDQNRKKTQQVAVYHMYVYTVRQPLMELRFNLVCQSNDINLSIRNCSCNCDCVKIQIKCPLYKFLSFTL